MAVTTRSAAKKAASKPKKAAPKRKAASKPKKAAPKRKPASKAKKAAPKRKAASKSKKAASKAKKAAPKRKAASKSKKAAPKRKPASKSKKAAPKRKPASKSKKAAPKRKPASKPKKAASKPKKAASKPMRKMGYSVRTLPSGLVQLRMQKGTYANSSRRRYVPMKTKAQHAKFAQAIADGHVNRRTVQAAMKGLKVRSEKTLIGIMKSPYADVAALKKKGVKKYAKALGIKRSKGGRARTKTKLISKVRSRSPASKAAGSAYQKALAMKTPALRKTVKAMGIRLTKKNGSYRSRSSLAKAYAKAKMAK